MDVLAFDDPCTAFKAWDHARRAHEEHITETWTQRNVSGRVSYFATRDGYSQLLLIVPIERTTDAPESLFEQVQNGSQTLDQAMSQACARYERMCAQIPEAAGAWEAHGGQALDALLEAVDQLGARCRLDRFESLLVFVSTAMDRWEEEG